MTESNLTGEIETIKNWSNGKETYPTKVDIFPTQNCNLNCGFCEFPDVSTEELENELEAEELLRIVGEAGDMNVETFGIIGGEAFTQRRIMDIMETVKEEDMEGSVTTNGTLLTEERVKKLVDIEWDLMRISIDGIGNTHDSARGKKGAFSRIVRSLDLFEKYSDGSPTLQINTVLNSQNYQEIPEIVQLANEYGINRMILLPVIEFNEESKRIKITESEKGNVEKNLREAKKLAGKHGIEINVDEVIQEELYTRSNQTQELIEDKEIPCFVPWYSISINAKGIATPCSQFEEEFGVDVRDKSLEEIWRSDKFERIRTMIANKDLPETCSKCCAPLLEENKKIRENIDEPGKLVSRYTR